MLNLWKRNTVDDDLDQETLREDELAAAATVAGMAGAEAADASDAAPVGARRRISVLIRPAHPTDAEGMRLIYNHAVQTSTATMDTAPRTLDAQLAWLAAHDGNNYSALVAQEGAGNGIVGFAALSPYNPKPGYRTSAEVSVYVHADWQRVGVGRMLLNELVADARRRGFVNLVAAITSENHSSRRLHSRLGFVEIGTLRKVARKFDRWIDVTHMQLILAPDA